MLSAHTPWPEPARLATPDANDVHLYRAPVPATLDPRLESALTPDERERASRLIVDLARRRFITARAALRLILGACLDLPPAAVPIRYAAQGKPHIDAAPLAFNVSHAGDLILLAVTWSGPVGIDVECLQPTRSWPLVAERFFSAGERAAIAAHPEEDRWRAFLVTWTRKEALVKLTGEGVWSAFDQADTSIVATPSRTLIDLEPSPGYLAALALGGPAGPVHPFTFSRVPPSP
ncbi:MAG: 4'-phosphopantetheinyl transferase superfamily protein [Lentisphaerae bacterium]|nr:4'-phosphopantetheinyl transferase superfamily protein [Lentisphaerota bacterium]